MKKQHVFAALTFVGVFLFAAAIAWLSGYNFDSRGDQLAFGFFMTTIFAGMISGFIYALTSGKI